MGQESVSSEEEGRGNMLLDLRTSRIYAPHSYTLKLKRTNGLTQPGLTWSQEVGSETVRIQRTLGDCILEVLTGFGLGNL